MLALMAGMLPILGCGSETSETAAAWTPELVVVVVVDTLAAGHVSHLGYDRPTTPELDALARDGVTFSDAVSPASYTAAAIPSILTSRLPDRHGVVTSWDELAEEEVTMAEVFKAEGFSTFGAVAVVNGGPLFGDDQGFDEFIELYVSHEEGETSVPGDRKRSLHMARATEFAPVIGERLDRRADGERLLLYMHMLEPHGPYDPPLPFKRQLTDERYPGPYEEGDRQHLRSRALRGQMGPVVITGIEHLYDTNVLYADHVLGEFFADLKRRGLYDEALIVVTADHGEAFWEHGERGHGDILYEEVAQVPLIVKFPAGDGPRDLSLPGLVSNMDLLPSICSWMGFPVPERELDGLSLAEYVADPTLGSPRESLLLRSVADRRRYALRFPEMKLIVQLEPEDPEFPGARQVSAEELFDLGADPAEQNDLAELRPDVSKRLRRRLLRELASLRGSQAKERGEIPAQEQELMRALGYLGGDGDL
ncbi:MAG: sulfatase [Planctomycetota bacterium]|nr:sulfatase [Planctomycetota bacterium]MDP6518539.1 sulfatase [Planctomycetota bacterium]MDP6839010.1 sulfatase [Planctomycetota bacterium]MDP6954343.1 sulfatase [Planctomycetota bacterium]